MGERKEAESGRRPRRSAAIFAYVLMCASCSYAAPLCAQTTTSAPATHTERPTAASAPASTAPHEAAATSAAEPASEVTTRAPLQESTAEERASEAAARALDELASALEHAQFEQARARALSLLATSTLSARQRNEALELLAVAQIAGRDELGAESTLAELFARDPRHAERLRDPGPAVSAAFARARSEADEPLLPLLAADVRLDGVGRALVEIGLGRGRDAIDSVHVFARSQPDSESTHLVADVGTRSAFALALPPASTLESSTWFELFVEARAPSGSVLARAGSADAPLRFSVPNVRMACAAQGAELRLRRAWWLWTSVAVVVASIGISGAIVAH